MSDCLGITAVGVGRIVRGQLCCLAGAAPYFGIISNDYEFVQNLRNRLQEVPITAGKRGQPCRMTVNRANSGRTEPVAG